MPAEEKKQKKAGVKLNFAKKKPGSRKMESRSETIKSNLRIDDVPYKGNAVLNANK